MERVVVCEPGVVGSEGERVGERSADKDGGFICPAARDVVHSVAAAAEDQEGHVEFTDVVDAGAMCFDGEVEGAEAVAAEGVGAALEDDGGGTEGFNGAGNDSAEDGEIRVVINAVEKRDVESEVFTQAIAVIVELAGPGEEVAGIFVEGNGHDAV